jgi:uncharacterized protein with PQ loop repeat
MTKEEADSVLEQVLNGLPVAAAAFAVPQFLPQLAGVRRTGDTSGVSWSWAALTSVNNGGWIVYFALSRLWTALVPAICATALAGVLALLLGRRGGVPWRPAAIVAAWAAVLAGSWAVAGRGGIGTALTVAFVIQVTPSVWTAYRTRQPSGISRGTWWLILAELLCWGIYGLHMADPRLIVLGWTGVAASVLMLVRARRGRRGIAAEASAQEPPTTTGFCASASSSEGPVGNIASAVAGSVAGTALP